MNPNYPPELRWHANHRLSYMITLSSDSEPEEEPETGVKVVFTIENPKELFGNKASGGKEPEESVSISEGDEDPVWTEEIEEMFEKDREMENDR